MSTTLDASPQSSNDRERHGAFVPATAAPNPPLIHGSTPNEPASNLFNFVSNPATNPSLNTFGGIPTESNDDAGSQDINESPSDILLGLRIKKQNPLPNKTRKTA